MIQQTRVPAAIPTTAAAEAKCRPCWALLVLALGLGTGTAARAATLEELQAELTQRNARIDELLRRVEALEQRVGVQTATQQAASAPSAAPAPAQTPSVAAAQPVPASSPDDAAAEPSRALERALVREGGLVLARGAFEVEPELRYTFRSFRGLQLVSQNGQAFVMQQDQRRDTLEPSLSLRVGLPWAMQAEVRIPYWFDRRLTTGSGAIQQDERISGWGDIEASLTKQLLTERPHWPGLLGTVGYKSATGHTGSTGALAPGFGYRTAQFGLTAVKRADPMVFFGSLSYTRTYAYTDNSRRLDPGDSAGLRFGTVLAASPETSLKLGVDLSRVGSLRLDDAGLPGTGQTVGLLQVGVSTLLSPRMLLSVQLGIGITRDAPDFRLTVGLPVRLN